jgi:hypothetical protein
MWCMGNGSREIPISGKQHHEKDAPNPHKILAQRHGQAGLSRYRAGAAATIDDMLRPLCEGGRPLEGLPLDRAAGAAPPRVAWIDPRTVRRTM